MSDILEQVLMSLCAYFLVCPAGIEGSPERVTVHYVCEVTLSDLWNS